MATNVIQLEAFEAPLRAKRICWYMVPGAPTIYPPGFQEQTFTESPPFQRRILITSTQASESWKMTDKWDSILMPQGGTDWSLTLTVLLNQPFPTLVFITPGTVLPQALFQKCAQAGSKSPTIVHCQALTLPLPMMSITYDAIFFPPAKAIDDSLMEATQIALQKLLPSSSLQSFSVKDALKDLRGAGATLVVSSIEESVPTLYWYYASEQMAKGKDLLTSVMQTLLQRDM